MSIASTIWTWEEGDCLHSRVTTNARSERLLARLNALGLLPLVETIHAFFGDRSEGGNGYELKWKKAVAWEHLQERLPKL